MAESKLLADVPFKVKLTDGTSTTVVVRLLDVVEVYQYIEQMVAYRSPDLVALCIAKDLDFVRTIERQSFLDLLKKCNELNFKQAAGMMSDPVAAIKLVPFFVGMGHTLAAGLAIGLPMKDLSAALAPLGSAAATGAESSAQPPPDSKPSSTSTSG